MRIGQIDYLIELKRNLDGPVIRLAVKYNSPIMPVKGFVQICLVEIIFAGLARLHQLEHVPLPDFSLNSQFSDSVLDFDVGVSNPVSVVFLAPSNPKSFGINKISQRNQIGVAIPRIIILAIRAVMILDIQFIMIKLRIVLP